MNFDYLKIGNMIENSTYIWGFMCFSILYTPN
jgi:hypothetical protein